MPHALRRISAILCLCIFSTAGLAAHGAPSAHEFTLKNGLKLIVKEDHRAPVVVSQIWYKIGASYEHDGITGISHMLEHMMFKGTNKHPPGEFSRIINANGGSENAFTGRDYTAYFQSLEKSRLKISFELEADRMHNLTLPKDEFKKEHQVVMEERRLRTDDDPQALTDEQFNATAFLTGPYHHSVIGWMDDIKHLTDADVRAWYKKWYAPNNATLVVAGDVDPDKVHKLAEKYFGPVKARKIPELKPRADIEQQGLRRITVEAPAEVPYLIMGYKVPVVRTAKVSWEPYALDVLAGVLAGGDSARLPRDLIRGSQVAASADAGYDLYQRYNTVFELDGTPAQGHTVDELRQALEKEVKALREKPIAEDELDRIKAQVVAQKVYQRDSVFYQAMQIGMLATVGLDWRLADKYVDRIRAVTPQQVQQVARKYLTEERLTIANLVPQSAHAKQPAQQD